MLVWEWGWCKSGNGAGASLEMRLVLVCFLSLRVLHCKAEFLSSGLQVGQSQDRDNLCLSPADKEVVVLHRDVDDKEVVRHEACADVTDVAKRNSSSHFD